VVVQVWLTLAVASPALAQVDGPVPPEGYVDRSGMSELVAWQTVNGFFAGTFLAIAVTAGDIEFDCDMASDPGECRSAKARAAGIALLGLASGLGVPFLVTRGHEVRTADALLVNRATLIGAMHGYILPFAAGLEPFDPGRNVYSVNVDEVRTLASLTLTGDMLGIATGTYLAARWNPAPGTVSFLGTLHSAAFIAGMSIGSSFPDHVDQDDWRLISGVSLGVADLALGIGLMNARRIDIGRNRVFWLDTGGLVGWLAGAGLGAALGGTDQRAVTIGGSAGMAAGFLLSYSLTSGSEGWRRRHEAGAAQGIEFDAPALRIVPVNYGTEVETQYAVDVLRGRF
jgi:hypothetical protein